MKKLTLLLMPVMPGFNAWAVNGFIEKSENSGPGEEQPEPIPADPLVKIIGGFTTAAGDLVFIPYAGLGTLIRQYVEFSTHSSIQPLDRGGLLLSFSLLKKHAERVESLVGALEPVSE